MLEYRLKGNWNELKGKAKEQWDELTDDELDRIDGSTDQLIGAIQKHYGRTVEQAYREVEDWRDGTIC